MREKEAKKLQKICQISAPLKFRGYLLSWMKGCSKLDRERDWESKVFRPRTLPGVGARPLDREPSALTIKSQRPSRRKCNECRNQTNNTYILARSFRECVLFLLVSLFSLLAKKQIIK